MISPRWSTFTWLSLMAMTALAAFWVGHLTALKPATPLASAPPEIRTPLVTLNASTPTVASVAPSEKPNPENRWNELLALPRTPAVETDMAALIEKLAETDPQRALSLAVVQINLRLRAELLRAALKGWGIADPAAAAEWAKTETIMDQSQAIEALLQGAIQHPDKAVELTSALIQGDAARASEYGTDLISALNESGQFDRAASFAVNGPANCRNDWILPAYSRWAEFQPQAAVASALQIADPGLRDTALNAIVTGWSPTDPQGLMTFAQNNLPPEQQQVAMVNALFFWADSDPAAAEKWIIQNNPGPSADNGIAQIALSSQLAQSPELAADWAENISSSQLRMDTLASVIGKWMAADPSGAETFVQTSPWLTPEDRSQLLAQPKNQFAP